MYIMNKHTFHLANEPFQSISNREKTVESRLFDEKRQLIRLGDTVLFTNRDHQEITLEAEVIGLLRYKNFHEMFINQDYRKFGGPSVEWLENQINQFYSAEEQNKFGVLGIEFRLIK